MLETSASGALDDPRRLHGRKIAILGPTESFVTRLHAETLQQLGLDVVLVTWSQGNTANVPAGVVVERVEMPRRQFRGLLQRGLQAFQHVGQQCYLSRYRQLTGRPAIDAWAKDIVYPYLMRGPLIRAARRHRPDWVLAEEASSYGLAAPLFPGPRLIFPFGGDIYVAAETWPVAHRIIGSALRSASMVIPASEAAAELLRQRFGVRDDRVTALYPGLDLDRHQRPVGDAMAERRRRWGLPPDVVVLANCRRFRPEWGSELVHPVFVEVARQNRNVHCLLLRGGDLAEEPLNRLREEINALGLQNQFTILDRDLSADEYVELATVADVFVSLMPIGDMRSQSVMEFAAGGSVPVISRVREYELMVERGFAAALPPPRDVAATVAAIQPLIADANLRETMRQQNAAYQRQYNHREAFREGFRALLLRLLPPG